MRNPTDSLLSRLAILSLAIGSLLLSATAGAGLAPVGISVARAQVFDNEDLLFFIPDANDHFGWAVAAGDFNGDGADDLATGIPDDDGLAGSGCDDCGLVVVRYGVPGVGLAEGLATTVLYQGLSGSPSPPDPGDHFGKALAAGDFNGDGFDDLAVGIPGDHFHLGTVRRLGAVQVFYGSAAGLETGASEYLTRGAGWTEVVPLLCIDEEFGAALAVGDFDGDSFDDLAIGAPRGCIVYWVHPDESYSVRGGEVFVAHGSAAGLLPLAGYGISEDSAGIYGDAADNERFGRALAAGDFDDDGHDDLAIGVPNEANNGALYVIMGSQFGLIYANSVFWWPGALGLEPEDGDRFGFALASADFDGDGHDDLAIGDPSEDLGIGNTNPDVGSISVAYGSLGWFDLSRTLNFTQGLLYADAFADEGEDQFGWALAAGDFDDDGYADLAVGGPGEDQRAGAVVILKGAPDDGLGATIGTFQAGLDFLPGELQSYEDFGSALAVGDFDGDGASDLAVGAPQYNSSSHADVGYEIVLYGFDPSLFRDGFESGSLERWSSASP